MKLAQNQKLYQPGSIKVTGGDTDIYHYFQLTPGIPWIQGH